MRISICLGYARGHISPFINLTVVAACQEYNHRGLQFTMIKHCNSAYIRDEVVDGDCDHGTTEQERKSVAVSSNAWPGGAEEEQKLLSYRQDTIAKLLSDRDLNGRGSGWYE